MKFGSVCSGIEAASVAFGPLGWSAAWFSEIEPFPCAVLSSHYPDVPNLGDMLALPEAIRAGKVEAPDLLCGGTPCQAFSVAGLRQSLDDARGNLSLTFCEIANAIDDVRADPCHTLAKGAQAPAQSLAPIAFSAKDYGADATDDLSPTLRAGGHVNSHANAGVMPAIAFDGRQRDVIQYGDKSGPLDTDPGTVAVFDAMRVRRLTPRECARLQGFPDDYLDITFRGKPAADGPKYKALGNSWAVPVVRWIGARIAASLRTRGAAV